MQELRLGCSVILLDDGHHDYTVLLELFAVTFGSTSLLADRY